ncbi:MAG: hypothetical protein CMH22_07000 [Methylophaga sp.]|uniref:hypothetical protein n=1 Tax=Methylophaga sp. UBA678 TaxID=1946901 RepID=UPI000C4A1F4C|nr:hypothetical protein [Methylophaga sp. UBA678]MAX51714.1 hypothetical protein [Methylophaga sp.]
MQQKHSTYSPEHKEDSDSKQLHQQRDLILTHEEALAGSPDESAACGEEDIGAGLEFLVAKHDHPDSGK